MNEQTGNKTAEHVRTARELAEKAKASISLELHEHVTAIEIAIINLTAYKARHKKSGVVISDATWDDVLCHLQKEVDELVDALHQIRREQKKNSAAVLEELGDIYGLLVHATLKAGFSMAQVEATELAKLKERYEYDEQTESEFVRKNKLPHGPVPLEDSPLPMQNYAWDYAEGNVGITLSDVQKVCLCARGSGPAYDDVDTTNCPIHGIGRVTLSDVQKVCNEYAQQHRRILPGYVCAGCKKPIQECSRLTPVCRSGIVLRDPTARGPTQEAEEEQLEND